MVSFERTDRQEAESVKSWHIAATSSYSGTQTPSRCRSNLTQTFVRSELDASRSILHSFIQRLVDSGQIEGALS